MWTGTGLGPRLATPFRLGSDPGGRELGWSVRHGA